MRAPLDGLPFLCTGTSAASEAAAALLEALGADVVRVPVLHGPEHARRVAALEPLGAVDATGLLVGEARPPFPVIEPAAVDPAAAWAASGALALTGPADRAPLAVDPVVPARLLGAGLVAQLLAACREVALDLDPLALLGERAAITGFGRQGSTAVGGMCHLVRAADGWVAVNLARPEDVDALPALLEGEVGPGAPWPEVEAAIARRPVARLDEQAALLGFPLGVLPAGAEAAALGGAASPRSPYVFGVPGPEGAAAGGRVARLRPAGAPPVTPAPQGALVVDLSSLWAGPLATAILRDAGARVVKVESVGRPDGARRGPSAFFDLLHHGKESVALDLGHGPDVAFLQRLVRAADVVVEGSRPRALEALGIVAAEVVASGRTTWISITAHGRHGHDARRVGFGDDAAVAGGLVARHAGSGEPPCFVADAAADPISGLYAAAAGLAALVGRRGQLVDVALRRSAAYLAAGAGTATPFPIAAAPPRARTAAGPAPALGAHTDAVRAELG